MENKEEVEELVRKIYSLHFEMGLCLPHELENIDNPFISWIGKCLVQLSDLIKEAPFGVSAEDPF